MNEKELRIAKISQLLNTAIRSQNSNEYNKALSLLENTGAKPTLKDILDAQVADNKRIKEEAKLKEELEDRIRLEKARLGLESEERKKYSKKQEANKLLQDSWNENMTLKELQKELNQLRSGDSDEDKNEEETNERTEAEMEEIEEKRLQEVIKRYEKMFGRIKGLDSNRSKAGSNAGKSIVSSKPQSIKSKVTEFSTISQKEAYEKLKQLDEEEDRIKREKEELMKFLEVRSQNSKSSSRPATVSSLYSNIPEIKTDIIKKKELPVIIEDEIKEKPKKRKKVENSVDELFKNLY